MLKLRMKRRLSSHCSFRSLSFERITKINLTHQALTDGQFPLATDFARFTLTYKAKTVRDYSFFVRVEILVFCTELTQGQQKGQYWQATSYSQSCQTRQNTFEYQRLRQIITSIRKQLSKVLSRSCNNMTYVLSHICRQKTFPRGCNGCISTRSRTNNGRTYFRSCLCKNLTFVVSFGHTYCTRRRIS